MATNINKAVTRGPSGDSSADKLFRELISDSGMSVVIKGELETFEFFHKLIDAVPELKQSGYNDLGIFAWERGVAQILWCVISNPSSQYNSGALFTPRGPEYRDLSSMYRHLLDGCKVNGFSTDAVSFGETSQECADLINQGGVVPAKLLLEVR